MLSGLAAAEPWTPLLPPSPSASAVYPVPQVFYWHDLVADYAASLEKVEEVVIRVRVCCVRVGNCTLQSQQHTAVSLALVRVSRRQVGLHTTVIHWSQPLSPAVKVLIIIVLY